MTRYLMSLQESVDLVEHAFLYAQPGDLFVKKAPASSVGTLARAVSIVLGHGDPKVRKIGMRHGEKMYETLLTREEMLKSEDQGEYFRVPLDARSLEYELFVEEGEVSTSTMSDYDSNNTDQLTIEQTCDLLRTLPEIQELTSRLPA